MIVSGILALFFGALTWTFSEYVIHRWLGHDQRFRPNLFAKEHIRHHIEGGYFAPAWKKGLAAVVITALLSGPAVFLLGWTTGFAYVGGFVGFYLFYEILHSREHTHPGLGAYGRWARGHHFYHHFTDARFNHGVTSPIWDHVFRTHRAPGTIRVPERLCMVWLKDEETGDIRHEHAWRFELRRSRAAAA